MLPHELADDACSLRPNVERLCVTVEVPFDGSLEPGEPTFYRSVIRSRARLTYGQAEAILAGRERAEPELHEALRLAERVALELRRRRFARGALRISSAEIAFAFDGRGGVERAWLESEPHAHALIEELMILANEAVAQLLGRQAPRGALPGARAARAAVGHAAAGEARRSRRADPAGAGARTALAGRGRRCSPRRRASASAGTSSRRAAGARRSRRSSSARSSRPATTRTTSATRASRARRTATSRRRSGATPTSSSTARCCTSSAWATTALPEELEPAAEHCSRQERAAAEVEYRADDICLAWLLEDVLFERGWEEPFEGEITGLIGSGLFVRFGDVFEGMLPSRRLPGDFYEVNPLETALVGRRGGRTYRLGDPIRVRVEHIRRTEGKVELEPGTMNLRTQSSGGT